MNFNLVAFAASAMPRQTGLGKTWRDFMGDQEFVEQLINMSTWTPMPLQAYVGLFSDGRIDVALADFDFGAPKKVDNSVVLKIPRLSKDDMANEAYVDYSNAIAGMIAQYEMVVSKFALY